MPKVVRCDACDRYYDGSIYDRCPYCNTEKPRDGMDIKEVTTAVPPAVPKEEKKKPFRFGFFRNKQEERRTEGTKKEIEEPKKEYTQEKTFDSDKNDQEKTVSPVEEEQTNKASRFEKNNETSIKRRGTVPMFAPGLFAEESEEEFIQDHDSRLNTADIKTVGRFMPKTELEDSEGTVDEEENPGGLFISPEAVYTEESPKNSAYRTAGRNSDLMESVKAASLTKGIYISQGGTSSESIVYPVVGWLVCVKGEEKGKSFNLRNGRNKIGRSELMDVKLLRETTVSRTVQASIIYDSKERVFSIVPGRATGYAM